MRRTLIIAASILAIALTACKNQPATTSAQSQGTSATAQANLTPEQLGELGAQIKKAPKDADKLLADRGLTEESFEQAVRKVAEDPAASKRYTEAYHKAGA